jgi:sortase B
LPESAKGQVSDMKKTIIIAILALLLGIGIIIHAWTQLTDSRQVYLEGYEAYGNLRDQIKSISKTDNQKPQESKTSAAQQPQNNTEESLAGESSTKMPQAYMPYTDINFEKLKEINTDAVAWLYCPDTVIDYPVMKAKDYNQYLRYLPDGTYNLNGSLFIDYNNAPDFTEQLTVIYGHHMKSGQMFGSLKGYKGQAYFEKHPYMYLNTENGNYRIDLIYGCVIGSGGWRERAFMYEENLSELLSYAAQNTTFTSDVQYTRGDRIVVMSTCSYEFDDARYILLGVLRPEYE